MIDTGRYSEALSTAEESLKIGKEIGDPEYESQCNKVIALAHLYAAQQKDLPGLGDLEGLDHLTAARAAIEAACKFDVPRNNHNVHALRGIIALAQHGRGGVIPPQSGDITSPLHIARESFQTAIAHADALLAQTPELYGALDAKGIALCGLAVVGAGLVSALVPAHTGRPQGSPLQDAVNTFRAARKINRDPGIVARVVRWVDALARAHPNGAVLLANARRAAEGNDIEL